MEATADQKKAKEAKAPAMDLDLCIALFWPPSPPFWLFEFAIENFFLIARSGVF